MNRRNRRFLKNLDFNKKKKAISAIIVVILLVVIAVVLVTLLLGWGKNLASDNLDKTNNFKQEYSADTLTMFDSEDFTNSKLLVENLKSDGQVTITGYKILSDSSHPLLNKINDLPEPVSLEEGSRKFIPMVQPPERTFDVQLITDQNKYIDVKNVYNEPEKSFAKLLTDQDGINGIRTQIMQINNGDFGILAKTDNGSDYDIVFIKLDSSGNEVFTYTYDGGKVDRPDSFVTTSDGGFGILGRTDNGSNYDILFIKLDSSGNEVLTYTYDGGFSNDYPKSLVTTSDGGFAILGRPYNGSDNDIVFIKLDSSGSEVFTYTYNGGDHDWTKSLVTTSDGGFGILGETDNGSDRDFVFIKLDSSGNEVSSYTYNGGAYDSPVSLVTTSDAGFGVLGTTDNGSDNDIVFIKLDSSGNEVSTYTYNGGAYESSKFLVTTSDGGFGILGDTYNGSDDDIVFIKLDSSGNEVFTYTYDGGDHDWTKFLVTTSDGGFAILGKTYNGSNHDIVFIKLDSSGNEVSTYTYDNGEDDVPESLVITSDGGFGILGRIDTYPSWWTGVEWGNNFLLIKLDFSLSEEFVSNLGGSPSGFDSDEDFFKEISNGGFIFTGYSGGYGNYDYSTEWLVVKTDSQGRCPEIKSLPVNTTPGEI